jgi:hypothetical protein
MPVKKASKKAFLDDDPQEDDNFYNKKKVGPKPKLPIATDKISSVLEPSS